MKEILWIGKRAMTKVEQEELGMEGTVINHIYDINRVDEIHKGIMNADVIALDNLKKDVSIELLLDILKLTKGTNKLLLISQFEEIDYQTYEFIKWEKVIRITVEKEDYIPEN